MEWKDILSLAEFIAIILVALAGVIVYWKKGGNKADGDLISRYEARDKLNSTDMTEMKRQIHDQQKDIGRLNGILEEKDKQIAILQSVDLTKNNALAEFMKYTTGVSQKADGFMEKSSAREDKILLALQEVSVGLIKIGDFMQKINDHFAEHPASV